MGLTDLEEKNKRIAELEAEVARCYPPEDRDLLEQRIAALEAEVARLRDAVGSVDNYRRAAGAQMQQGSFFLVPTGLMDALRAARGGTRNPGPAGQGSRGLHAGATTGTATSRQPLDAMRELSGLVPCDDEGNVFSDETLEVQAEAYSQTYPGRTQSALGGASRSGR